MDASRFNQAEQAQINAMVEQKQVTDFMNMFTGVVDRCFKECANDFTTKAVTGREAACVQRCADRFLKHAELVSNKFAELSQTIKCDDTTWALISDFNRHSVDLSAPTLSQTLGKIIRKMSSPTQSP